MPAIDELFTIVKDEEASDLHLQVGYPPMLRLRGELVRLKREPLTNYGLTGMLYEILDEEQRTLFEERRDLDLAYELPDVATFRCNIMHTHRGIGGVFRIIPTKILTLEQLNLPESIRIISDMIRGMVLVTGPTGDGYADDGSGADEAHRRGEDNGGGGLREGHR